MLTPVKYDAAGDSKNSTTLATSSSEPNRRIGIVEIIWVATSAGSAEKYWLPAEACSSTWRSHIAPGPMNAGEIAFTRMLNGARSFALLLVSPMTAAFDAEYPAMFGAPPTPAIDALFTITPDDSVLIIRDAVSARTLNAPTTLTEKTCSTSLVII